MKRRSDPDEVDDSDQTRSIVNETQSIIKRRSDPRYDTHIIVKRRSDPRYDTHVPTVDATTNFRLSSTLSLTRTCNKTIRKKRTKKKLLSNSNITDFYLIVSTKTKDGPRDNIRGKVEDYFWDSNLTSNNLTQLTTDGQQESI